MYNVRSYMNKTINIIFTVWMWMLVKMQLVVTISVLNNTIVRLFSPQGWLNPKISKNKNKAKESQTKTNPLSGLKLFWGKNT